MSTKSIYRTWKMISPFLCVLALCMLYSPKTTAQHTYSIRTIAGNGTQGYTGDGAAATAAELSRPQGVAVDTMGNVYVVDFYNDVIRKINSSGIISTIAGTGAVGYSGNGGLATSAKLGYPISIACTKAGDVYINEYYNFVIRKISGGIITVIAGDDTAGYSGNGGPATLAKIENGTLMLDDSVNLYLAEEDSDVQVVRKINATDGKIHLVAGKDPPSFSSSYSGGGVLADSVVFNNDIFTTAVDHSGNLYLEDQTHCVMWKVTAATDTITIIAGIYNDTSSGIQYINSMCLDKSGNIYIADFDNERIRKIEAATGIIYTIAGNGTFGYSGDGGPADSAEFSDPWDIAVDTAGKVYISDWYNNCIRMLTPDTTILFTKGLKQSISVCENLSDFSIDSLLTVINKTTKGHNGWSVFNGPLHGTAYATYSVASDSGFITPTGLYYTPTYGYNGTDMFTIKAYNNTDTVYTTIYVTVKPFSVSPITGNNSLCVMAKDTLHDATIGGTWTSDNSHAMIDTNGVITAITAGSDIITYAATNSCGTIATTKSITIDTVPNVAVITGPASVCTDAYTFLTDAAAGGVWGVTNTHASVFSGYDYGEVHGLTRGIDTITYTVTNTCGTAASMKAVTIDSLPVIGDIDGAAEVCTGASITLTDTTAGGTWSATNTNATAIDGTVSGITAGVDIIQYTVSSECGTSVISKIITVEPYAPPVSGDTSICPSKSTLLADAVTGGIWSVANANAVVNASGLVTGEITGTDTITYTITDVCGTATASSIINIVTGTNAGIITGDSTVCLGKAIALSDTVSGGTWRAYNDSVVIAHGIVAGILPGLDTITYSVTAFCGTAEAMFVVAILSEEICDSIDGVHILSKDQIKVYPNPATGVLTIELPQSNSSATLQLMNIMGNVVITKNVAAQTTQATMDMAGLPAGNYLLSVRTGDTVYRQKVTLAN